MPNSACGQGPPTFHSSLKAGGLWPTSTCLPPGLSGRRLRHLLVAAWTYRGATLPVCLLWRQKVVLWPPPPPKPVLGLEGLWGPGGVPSLP